MGGGGVLLGRDGRVKDAERTSLRLARPRGDGPDSGVNKTCRGTSAPTVEEASSIIHARTRALRRRAQAGGGGAAGGRLHRRSSELFGEGSKAKVV